MSDNRLTLSDMRDILAETAAGSEFMRHVGSTDVHRILVDLCEHFQGLEDAHKIAGEILGIKDTECLDECAQRVMDELNALKKRVGVLENEAALERTILEKETVRRELAEDAARGGAALVRFLKH